jgi:CIC family chloride channel protein
VPVFQGSDLLQVAAETLSASHVPACLIQLWDGTCYAMTSDELISASATLTPDAPLERAVSTERVPVLFPDMPLDSALPHFQRWPLLPVMNRAIKGKIEGIVSLEDVLRRYQKH